MKANFREYNGFCCSGLKLTSVLKRDEGRRLVSAPLLPMDYVLTSLVVPSALVKHFQSLKYCKTVHLASDNNGTNMRSPQATRALSHINSNSLNKPMSVISKNPPAFVRTLPRASFLLRNIYVLIAFHSCSHVVVMIPYSQSHNSVKTRHKYYHF